MGKIFQVFHLFLQGALFLFAEVVDFDIRGEKSTLRVSSRALWPKPSQSRW